MAGTVRGAVDGTGAFAFYIENTPLQYLAPGPRKYMEVGVDSLRESYYRDDGSFAGLRDPAGPEGGVIASWYFGGRDHADNDG